MKVGLFACSLSEATVASHFDCEGEGCAGAAALMILAGLGLLLLALVGWVVFKVLPFRSQRLTW